MKAAVVRRFSWGAKQAPPSLTAQQLSLRPSFRLGRDLAAAKLAELAERKEVELDGDVAALAKTKEVLVRTSEAGVVPVALTTFASAAKDLPAELADCLAALGAKKVAITVEMHASGAYERSLSTTASAGAAGGGGSTKQAASKADDRTFEHTAAFPASVIPSESFRETWVYDMLARGFRNGLEKRWVSLAAYARSSCDTDEGRLRIVHHNVVATSASSALEVMVDVADAASVALSASKDRELAVDIRIEVEFYAPRELSCFKDIDSRRTVAYGSRLSAVVEALGNIEDEFETDEARRSQEGFAAAFCVPSPPWSPRPCA